MNVQIRKLIAYGTTGRLGRLLEPAWGDEALCLARAPRPGTQTLQFDLEEWPHQAPLPRCHALLVMAGATQIAPGDVCSHAQLAQSAAALCRAQGIGHLMLMSSAAIYGRAAPPLSEERAPTPASHYGEAKALLEQRAKEIGGDDLSVTVCRLANVAGADALLGRGPVGEIELDHFADGRSPRRSYIGAQTLADTLLLLAARPPEPFRLLNVAQPGSVEMADLARAAGAKIAKRPAPDTAIAEVTLELDALSEALGAPLPSADPETLVAEWRSLEAQL